jgi:hypothetical protein
MEMSVQYMYYNRKMRRSFSGHIHRHAPIGPADFLYTAFNNRVSRMLRFSRSDQNVPLDQLPRFGVLARCSETV